MEKRRANIQRSGKWEDPAKELKKENQRSVTYEKAKTSEGECPLSRGCAQPHVTLLVGQGKWGLRNHR